MINGISVMYQMYPLGMTGAEEFNDRISSPVSRLGELNEWIPHLKELNVQGVYLGPVFESGSHGYDTIDYRMIDRRLGTLEDLQNFIEECHQNGIRVILDGVFNHTGRSFFAFEDISHHRENSRYKFWYKDVDFNQRSSEGDSFSYDCWNGYGTLPRLNLDNHEVTRYLLDSVGFWISELKIDGLRLDAADCLSQDFLNELMAFCRNKNQGFIFISEVIHGDYKNWIRNKELDTVTNYEIYKGLWSSLNDKNLFELAYSLKRQFGSQGIYQELPLYNFADNHDVDRILSRLDDPTKIFTLYCLLFTIPGVPSLYYGSEFGLKGLKAPTHDREIRSRERISFLQRENPNRDLFDSIKRLAQLRVSSSALLYGNYTEIFKDHEQLVFLRKLEHETILVCINSSGNEKNISINIPELNGEGLDLLNGGSVRIVNQGKFSCTLYSNWARVFRFS